MAGVVSPAVKVKTEEGRPLSVGDALAVAALLLFIIAWLAGWSFLLWWWEEEGNDAADLGFWESMSLLALAYLPSMWAARLAKSIIANAVPGKSWEWER